MAELLISGFRLGVSGVIFCGVGVYLYRKLHPAWQFVPLLTVCCIGLLIYAAGLLNIMPLTAGAVAAFGLWQALQAVRAAVQNGSSARRPLSDPYHWYPLLFFALLGVYILYYVRGGRYPDGDTMTHWGVIVREMHETNRLPNFSTQEVVYQSYPPATACFLYFICFAVGYYESMAMAGQALIIAACLLAPFALVRRSPQKGRVLGQCAILTLYAVYALQFNITLDDLKVDNLQPLLTLAAVCMVLYGWNEPRRALQMSAPVLCFLILIKNSSPLFCACVMLLLLCCVRTVRPRPYRAFLGCAVTAPLFTLFLWQSHIRMVFADAGATRHSTSLRAMAEIFSRRTPEELDTILTNFMIRWFRPVPDVLPNGSGEWPALLILTLLTAAALCTRQYRPRRVAAGYLGVILGYVGYKLGLLGMYVFNMPDENALYVGSYERYTMTATILLYGLSALLAARLLADCPFSAKGARGAWAAGLCACLLLQPLLFPVAPGRYARPDYAADGLYRRLCRLQRTYDLPEEGGRVLVCSQVRYAEFFVRFAFRSNHAIAVEPQELDRILREEEPRKTYYEWLILDGHDEEVDAVLQAHGLPTDQAVLRFEVPPFIRDGFTVWDSVLYYEADESLRDGWLRCGERTYYVDGDGYALEGLHEIGGAVYYFSAFPECTLQYGEQTVNDETMVFDEETGARVSGGVTPLVPDGFNETDGALYCYRNGLMVKNSWFGSGEWKYYLDGEGRALEGLHEIDGETYYFKEFPWCNVQYGEQTVGGETLYFDEETGALCEKYGAAA